MFEQGDMDVVKECLENQQDSQWTRDPDMFPATLHQWTVTTETATLQTERSEDEDSSSVTGKEYTTKLVTCIPILLAQGTSLYNYYIMLVFCPWWLGVVGPKHLKIKFTTYGALLPLNLL